MDLRKKMKGFFTLTRTANGGFTLVELIVVIAILAILAGVAIPVYSGYITKTNMTADEALVAEVENALILAYYSGNITENGYVVLTTGNPKCSDENVTAALTAAFGDMNGLKLKYDGWTEGGNFGAYASSVNGSFVTNGTDALLNDVENCAGKLAEFMVGTGLFKGKEGASRLDGLLQSNGAVAGLLEGYEGEEIDSTVLANATVFGLASGMQNTANAEAVINNFANMECLKNPITYTGNPNALTETANKYAALEAFVKFVNCDGATKALNDFNASGMDSEDPGTIITNLDYACFAAYNAVFNDMSNFDLAVKGHKYYGLLLDAEGNTEPIPGKSQARQDGEAYVSTMQAVDSLSTDYAGNLGNAGMFTDGTVTKDLNTYLNLAAALPSDGAYYVVSFRIGKTGIIFDQQG